ncbi:MAG: hypothetical protein ABFR35_02155 [Thermodesulfobacteriota bacterium]
MKCDRLISLVKNWYLKVQEEAMAPARMVAFMEQHISQCEECLDDPDVRQEADKIREIVLPPSKVPKSKVVRVPKEDIKDSEDIAEAETSEEDEAVETKEDAVEVEDGGGDDEDEVEDDDEDNGFNPELLVEDDEI